ncbi:alpha/beta hydrolase [Thalassotalea sp. M1531]|uniref:Alpha/beta hydrolase n=1 Tax=Thalassotalea algicola TaxID=2716224 RepID=A0A7Y0Q5N0_9GAMM|nr:alpha/beta hydrolase [Thalassotalea algicola]NMP30291.1 alpha/beta hydrolase [Thalassotalea algicola]
MRLFLGLVVLTFLLGCSSTKESDVVTVEKAVCDIPYSTYQATVTGYCQEVRADLTEELPTTIKNIELKPVEQIPEVFWFSKKMEYTLNKQDGPAPLVFAIAGTGASHEASKMLSLQKTLYAQGYHVISISSPTFSNYIINATTHEDMTGDLAKDAKTLYKTMQKVYAQVQEEDNVEATSFSLTGYSLGGAHSAFISFLDETEKKFNFEKVVLVNPPVSLYNSVQVLDGYLDLVGDREAALDMVESIFDRFAEQYAVQESSKFTQDSIYSMFQGVDLREEELKLLIGASFRMSSTDMMFAIDASYNIGGFIYKNHEISKFESLTHSMHRADEITFTDYFDRHLLPWTIKLEPELTRDEMIARLSLKNLEDYLSKSDKISVVTNADDLILIDGEIDYLREVFGDRAKIFERGGHCGNMDRKSFVEYMNTQFTGEKS